MPLARRRVAFPTPLAAIAERADTVLSRDLGAVVVSGVTLDSRVALPGDLYAALPGFNVHGACFARAAVEAGAVAVLTDPEGLRLLGAGAHRVDISRVPVLAVERPRDVLGEVAALVYGEPARQLQLFGITGTNGKTTTAYLLESALGRMGVATGLIGTVETRIGDERLQSVRTTPEATDLHAMLAMMRERGTRSVVMEVSSHALDQHRVDAAGFDIAIFTNLSQDHLDFHGDMERYFAAKALLFSPEHARRGVVCIDDEWGARLSRQAAIPVVTVSSRPGVDADFTVRQRNWPSFSLVGPGLDLQLTCHLPGTFNVVNTALAAVGLLEAGYRVDEIVAAMSHPTAVPGRMERVCPGDHRPGQDTAAATGQPLSIVDFAHTPDAVGVALQALRPTTAGRLIVVLGAGGDRDRGKRAAMGAVAARYADLVVVTDDNPRSEDPGAIRAAVLAGARIENARRHGSPEAIMDGGGRAAAIATAVRLAAGPDDTVLVLGKGHETGQEVAGVTHPFDDRDAIRAALDGTPYRPEADG